MLFTATSSASCVKKGMGDSNHSPELVWTVTTHVVITVRMTCHVISNVRHRNGMQLAMWHCCCLGTMVMGGPCVSARWVEMNVDWGTDRGIVKYTTMTNDNCRSLFVIWLPRRPQRHGTWILYQRAQWWGQVSLTLLPCHLVPFVHANRRL